MKIVILVSLFHPFWLGGTEIATQNIAEKLSKMGNDVCVITSRDKGTARMANEDGYYVFRVTHPKIKFFGPILFWFNCFWAIKKYRPDVVHSQTIQMAVPCFFAKKILKIPYIVNCHGSDVYMPWRLKKIISRSVLKEANAVIALTKDMKKRIESFRINLKNIFIIPNGIESENFKDLSKVDFRNGIKINNSENVLLFVGTLKAVKGVEYLIQAMNVIREKKPNTKLLIAGEGEERARLEGLSKKMGLENYIYFLGRIDNKNIPKLMLSSDIFILPSLSEGLPVTILEALASGLPIVATRLEGVAEIIKDGQNGFLVDIKNPKQIAEKILFLLSDGNAKKNISFNNIKKSEKYSWDSIANKLTEVYRLCQTRR